MSEDPWRQTAECKDASGRPKKLTIALTEENMIGILTPPGEVAKVDLSGGREVQRLLTLAMLELANRLGPHVAAAGEFARRFPVVDYSERDLHLVLAAHGGAVTLRVGLADWCQMTPEVADAMADELRLAAAVAREQQRRQR